MTLLTEVRRGGKAQAHSGDAKVEPQRLGAPAVRAQDADKGDLTNGEGYEGKQLQQPKKESVLGAEAIPHMADKPITLAPVKCPACGRRCFDASSGAVVQGRCVRCKVEFRGVA